MPLPVTTWVTETFPTAKSLNLALYTCDGTNDNPNGIAFHAYRPLLFDAYGTAVTFHSNASGSQQSLSSPGPASIATTTCSVIYDTAGYFGQTSDCPGGLGFYQFTPAVHGSVGDGVSAGGWRIVSHFIPVKPTATQVSTSADILQVGGLPTSIAGTRQPSNTSVDSCPFFLDLLNSGGITWQPALTLRDSSSTSTTPAVNVTDASGETPRFYTIWESVSSTSVGQATFSTNGDFEWTAPSGVTVVTVQATAAGGGGGGGNITSGNVNLGGGGGGGGEFAQGSVNVTPGNPYTVIVGAGGGGGIPGQKGSPGGQSQFAGDVNNVTANGGAGGGSASTTVNGAGGAGGSGSPALTEFHGGAGATGSSSNYGGGGGSSAGTRSVGNAANSGSGAPAPFGGGPGGGGGSQLISIVQTAAGNNTTTNSLTVKFKNPPQSGNSILAFVYYQGVGDSSGTIGTEPAVTLLDGSQLTQQISGDLPIPNGVSIQVGLHDIYSIAGGAGQQGVNIQCFGTSNSQKGIICELYEVSGLGSNPAQDASSSHTQGPSQPTIYYQQSTSDSHGNPQSTPTHAGPDLWVAATGGQQTSNFSVNNPTKSEGWTTQSAQYVSNGGIRGAMLTAFQVQSKAGNMLFSGTYSKGVSKGTFAFAYTSSAVANGKTPGVGPGGGGGAGFGASGAAGSGLDGLVTLTWNSVSGSAYGTPAIPVPFSNWGIGTTIGAQAGPSNVNLNDNTGIRDVLNFLSNPPIFRISSTAGGTVAANSTATILFSGAGAAGGGTVPTIDNYSGWNGSTNTFTVPRTGLYLAHGLVFFAASSSGLRQTGLSINGQTYWGPVMPTTSTGEAASSKTQIFSLLQGDTVQLTCRQSTAGNLATSTANQTRMFLAWLTATGLPQELWQPPDATFRWVSGTSAADLPPLFQQHLGNDLGFLVNRPYVMAYQSTAQSNSIAQNAFTSVILDQQNGIVHQDVGDNYLGWQNSGISTNNYQAQVAGWYLMVGEFFTTQGTAATSTAIAGIQPTTSGGITPSQPVDYYQQLAATTNATSGGGATVFGLQYLSVGESVTPVIQAHSYGGNFGTLVGTKNGGSVASHLTLVWLSE